jgi:ABC-type dipeptide/oligopeptide/nickel transport system permease subunit
VRDAAIVGVADPEWIGQEYRSNGAELWRRFRSHRLAVLGLGVVGVLTVLALAAPVLTRLGWLPDPYRLDIDHAHSGFGAAHWLGTDPLGRDLLARVVYGARVSLSIGVSVEAIVVLLGGGVGLLAGYFGGRIEVALMRFTDAVFAFPGLLFILFVASVLGPGYWNVFLAVAAVSWVGLARLVRAQVLSIKEQEYLAAAIASGSRPSKVILRHVLPNSLAPLLVAFTFGIPEVIFSEAFLSFVGVGLRPPTPSWGVMVAEGYMAVYAYPREVLVPAGAICVATLAFTFIGDGLRDAFDPRAGR